MIVDKKVMKKLIDNFRCWENGIKSNIEEFINVDLAEVETVEELMSIKTDIILTMLDYIPITSDYCYFCLELDNLNCDKEKCSKCAYKDYHNGTCEEKSSDFMKIFDAKEALADYIVNLYYKEEKYNKAITFIPAIKPKYEANPTKEVIIFFPSSNEYYKVNIVSSIVRGGVVFYNIQFTNYQKKCWEYSEDYFTIINVQ